MVTDCGALDGYIYLTHKSFLSNRMEEVAAAAIKAGINLDYSTIL